VAGTVGYVVDAGTTVLFHPLLGVYIARVPAFIASATSTWLFNRSITFKERGSHYKSIWREYIHYMVLMLAGLVVNYIAYTIAVTILPNGVYSIIIAVAVGDLTGMIVNFFFSRKYIYNKRVDDKD